MGFWDWLTGSRRRQERADRQLLSALLHEQARRSETDAKRLELQNALEIKKLELEFSNLEAVHEQKRKDREAAEELRQKRREWAKNSRAKKTEREQLRIVGRGLAGCVVCTDPSSPNLTAAEISWHQQGHPGAVANG